MLDLTLARDTKNNEKSFLQVGLSEKEGQRRWTPLLNNARGSLRYSSVLIFFFFVSFFNGTLSSYTSWVAGQQDGSRGGKVFAIISEHQVHDHLRNLNVQKSMGPNEMQWEPRGNWELTDVVVKHSPMIVEKSWGSDEIASDWKKWNIVPLFKNSRKEDSGNYQSVGLTSLPGRIMKQILLKALCRQMIWDGSAQPHQEQVLPDQSSRLLWWSDCVSGQGKG